MNDDEDRELSEAEIQKFKAVLIAIGENEVVKASKLSTLSIYKALAGFSGKMHRGTVLQMRAFLQTVTTEDETDEADDDKT